MGSNPIGSTKNPFYAVCTGPEPTDCLRDYAELKRRGVQFDGEPKVMLHGTGVMMRDLYGNRIYLNQEPHS